LTTLLFTNPNYANKQLHMIRQQIASILYKCNIETNVELVQQIDMLEELFVCLFVYCLTAYRHYLCYKCPDKLTKTDEIG